MKNMTERNSMLRKHRDLSRLPSLAEHVSPEGITTPVMSMSRAGSSSSTGTSMFLHSILGGSHSTLEFDDVEVGQTSMVKNGSELNGGCSESIISQSQDSDFIFDQFFDLSTERLRHVFNQFDQKKQGVVSYEDLRKGLLRYTGLKMESDENFEYFVSILDSDKSNDISFSEFEDGLRLLMMQQLFMPVCLAGSKDSSSKFEETIRDLEVSPINIIDYDALRIEHKSLITESQMKEFMFDATPLGKGWYQCRWIDVKGHERSALSLKRLAVKYSLHPLSLEDSLQRKHRAKVDSYSNHHFFIIPIVSIKIKERANKKQKWTLYDRLVYLSDGIASTFYSFLACRYFRGELSTNLDSENETGCKEIQVLSCNVCLFSLFTTEASPKYNTLITFRRSDNDIYSEIWKNIKKELGKSYSKLRQYDSQYLSYLFIDKIVDSLWEVSRSIWRVYEAEKKSLESWDVVDQVFVNNMKASVSSISRKIKPLRAALIHIIQDDRIVQGVTIYFRDVLENLDETEESLKNLISRCDELKEEYEKLQSASRDRTLYTLTVVTTIFLPAQFFTGVFGMNFEYMPELQWKPAYYVFWAMVFMFFLLGMIYFRCGSPRAINYHTT